MNAAVITPTVLILAGSVSLVITPAASFLACTVSLSASDRELPVGIQCPVCDQAASAEHAADWKGGQVYLACPKCAARFRGAPKEYAVKANSQLVATGQAKQVACPITGRELNSDRQVNVGGVDISFCCVGCQGRVARAKGDVQRYLVFSENAFAKGFAVGK